MKNPEDVVEKVLIDIDERRKRPRGHVAGQEATPSLPGASWRDEKAD